ncbi:hypothetical protein BJ742DRAFT_737408 [Cladochytrium replicatum]|nr:hypothetical protein BJ742DRAFT_737408 [Cladochytrium replicatum]
MARHVRSRANASCHKLARAGQPTFGESLERKANMSERNELMIRKALGFTPRPSSRTELSKIAVHVSNALLRRPTSRAKGGNRESNHDTTASEGKDLGVSALGKPGRVTISRQSLSNSSSLSVPRPPPKMDSTTQKFRFPSGEKSSVRASMQTRSPDEAGSYSQTKRMIPTNRTIEASSSIPIPAQRSSLFVLKDSQRAHMRFSSSQSSDHTVESFEVAADLSTPPTRTVSMTSRHRAQPVRSGVQRRPCSFSSFSSSVTSISSEPLEEEFDEDSQSASLILAKQRPTLESYFNSKTEEDVSTNTFVRQTGAVMNAIEGMLEKLLEKVESIERRVEQLSIRETAPQKLKTDEKSIGKAYSHELLNEWVEKAGAAEVSLANLENRVASGLSNVGIIRETPAIGHHDSGISTASTEILMCDDQNNKEGCKEESTNEEHACEIDASSEADPVHGTNVSDCANEITAGGRQDDSDIVKQSSENVTTVEEPQHSTTVQSEPPHEENTANRTVALLSAMAVLPLRVADLIWDSAVIGCAETILLPVRAVRVGRGAVSLSFGAVHGMLKRRRGRLPEK